MPAPYSANLRWRVIWFVHIVQNSVTETSFFLCVCERTMERYISKFLVNGGVQPEPVGRSYGSISFAHREELIFFAYQIWKPQFHSVVQFPFDNCHSPFSPTFFEIGVYRNFLLPISFRKIIKQGIINQTNGLKSQSINHFQENSFWNGRLPMVQDFLVGPV